MLVVLISWCYYFCILFLLGYSFLELLNKWMKINITFDFMQTLLFGIMVTTVYAQIFSLVYKVGLLAHLIMLLTALITLRLNWSKIHDLVKKVNIRSKEFGYYLVMILVIAFFTSRGQFHTDTMIYHAQAIHWIEEYGIVPGLANLQQHFGYNSSYFPFAALFSMKFLSGISLHTTTGFIECLMCIWAGKTVSTAWGKRNYVSFFCGIMILLYAFINITGSMSPASDYVTNFVALYVITKWVILWEQSSGNIHEYCLLCVITVYLFTLKISGGLLVMIVLYPAVYLIRKKEWKAILSYLSIGLIILLPFLVRNVIISGWILYPFSSLDLFLPDWKVPLQYVENDSRQIQVWGKCLFDVELANIPLKQWLPVWWENQERYYQMLIYGNALSLLFLAFAFIKSLFNKKEDTIKLMLLLAAIMACILLWFFTAPFIRYGLSFLLALPAISVGWAWKDIIRFKSNICKVFLFYSTLCMVVCFTPMVDQYVKDAGMFVKQRVKESYYILQKDYEVAELQNISIHNVIFFAPANGDQLGYAPLPSMAYPQMMFRSEMRGKEIKNGFKPIAP